MADDEQMACLNHRRVSVQTLVIVDEVVVIHGLDFRIHFHLIGATVEDVFIRHAIVVHLNSHVVVHTQSL